ncbi:hypothetical protein CVT24_011064 [Panaeolus cyanescens]|uniref:RING-type domain-containing protein n=1 Tax=Panaeolus cyanescens TaxID=181874 RepID=A0A409VG15_9AGAR|nr:hypothetical protein CVT24_011064 [Panaeolus cyanescens]
MSTRQSRFRTPRGIPIMDVMDIPDDLPAPLTTRPLLSRTESLARSRTTSRTNSRDNSVSSSSENREYSTSRSTFKTMENNDSVMSKEDSNNGGGSNEVLPGKASSSHANLKEEEATRFVPSSESPEPMDYHSNTQASQAPEPQGSPSSIVSRGKKRQRSPDIFSENGGLGSDPLDEELQDELDLIEKPLRIKVRGRRLDQIASDLSLHQPSYSSGSRGGIQSGGGPMEVGESSSTTQVKQEEVKLDNPAVSQVDRDDSMKVEMMLDAQEDEPMTPMPSSSSNVLSHSEPTSQNTSESGGSSHNPLPRRDKGKSRAKPESTGSSIHPAPVEVIDITDSPPIPHRTLPSSRGNPSYKGKQREEQPGSSEDVPSGSGDTSTGTPGAVAVDEPNPEDDNLLSSYTCPICFCAPTNATLTPCGHICCGECLFTAIKTTQQRASVIGPPEDARCPVCRAVIPGWDGKGGGVIGLKIRAVFSL